MTNPLRPGRPGRSEFSHGVGRYPHPQTDYTPAIVKSLGLANAGGLAEDKQDRLLKRSAELRSDPTNSMEDLTQMPYVLGNPDMYGPDEPLVQDRKRTPPRSFKQPKQRFGVQRQK